MLFVIIMLSVSDSAVGLTLVGTAVPASTIGTYIAAKLLFLYEKSALNGKKVNG